MRRYDPLPVLPASPPSSWIAATLHDAELSLLNERYAQATDELNWALTLIAAGLELSDASYLKEGQAKALGLLQTISTGVDVFGRNLNFVPLTGFEFSESLIRTQIEYLAGVEPYLERLKTEQLNQEQRLEGNRQTASQLRHLIESTSGDAIRLSARSSALQDEVRRLFDELVVLHARLMQAQRRFKAAVEAQAGCGFADVLKVAAMVATVVSTAGAGAAAVGAAATAYNQYSAWNSAAAANPSWRNIRSDAMAIARIVKPVSEGADKFSKAYAEAKDAIAEAFPEAPSIPDELRVSDDFAKILAAKADFDRAIEPYMSMSAAKAYKAAMDRFVATAECRNNKILEFDSTIAQIVEMRGRVAFERTRAQELNSAALARLDARLGANVVFLESALTSLKWRLIRQLVGLERSLTYMTGEEYAIEFSDFSVAALQAITADLVERYASIQAQFGQDLQSGTAYRMPLADLLEDADIQSLLAGETVTFAPSTIGEGDLFPELYGVQTARIQIVAEDGRPLPGSLNFTFEHLGRSVVRLRDKGHRVYTHVPIRTTFRQRNGVIGSKGDLTVGSGSRAKFVGVSPYGPWRMKQNSADETASTALAEAYISFDVASRALPI
jgi:hypothetical protein